MCHVPKGGRNNPTLFYEWHDGERVLESIDKPSRIKHKLLNSVDKSSQKLGKKATLTQRGKKSQ